MKHMENKDMHVAIVLNPICGPKHINKPAAQAAGADPSR